MKRKLKLGDIVITRKAQNAISEEDIANALKGHRNKVCGAKPGNSFSSIYPDSHNKWFWISTNPDRSETIVFLPGDVCKAFYPQEKK